MFFFAAPLHNLYANFSEKTRFNRNVVGIKCTYISEKKCNERKKQTLVLVCDFILLSLNGHESIYSICLRKKKNYFYRHEKLFLLSISIFLVL